MEMRSSSSRVVTVTCLDRVAIPFHPRSFTQLVLWTET